MKKTFKRKLKKDLKVVKTTAEVGNPVSDSGNVNFIKNAKMNVLNKHQKTINEMGILVDYRCGRQIEDDMCLGRVRRIKSHTVQCDICKTKWIKMNLKADANVRKLKRRSKVDRTSTTSKKN